MINNRCFHCGNDFEGVRRTKFCSNPCRRRAYHERTYIPSPHSHLDRAAVGAAGEMRVAADLVLKGFSVYRAVSPHSSCDLLALRGDRSWRIEVRTGRNSKRGKPFWPKAKRDKGRYDVMVVVLDDRLVYIPELT